MSRQPPSLNGNLGKKLFRARKRITQLEQRIRDLTCEAKSLQHTLEAAKKFVPKEQWQAVFHAPRQRVSHRVVERDLAGLAAEFLNQRPEYSCYPTHEWPWYYAPSWTLTTYAPDGSESERECWPQEVIDLAKGLGWRYTKPNTEVTE